MFKPLINIIIIITNLNKCPVRKAFYFYIVKNSHEKGTLECDANILKDDIVKIKKNEILVI